MKKFYCQLLSVTCLLFMAAGAFAQPGVLDPTFGVGGKVSINFPGLSMLNQDIKLQPDKKMLVLSVARSGTWPDSINYHYLLSRLLPGGKPDSTFGINGRIADSSVRAYAIALQPDGKILLTGFTMDSTRDFILKRYNTNGTIDNSFGTNGQVKTSFITDPTFEPSDVPTGVYVLPNGKILLAGYSQEGNQKFSNARFNSNGSIDSTYGINGKAHYDSPSFISLDIGEGFKWIRTPFLTILDSSQRLVSIAGTE